MWVLGHDLNKFYRNKFLMKSHIYSDTHHWDFQFLKGEINGNFLFYTMAIIAFVKVATCNFLRIVCVLNRLHLMRMMKC